MELDCSNEEDAGFLKDVQSAFEHLKKDYPDHVFQIQDANHIDQLFDEGRLADETVIPPPSTGSTVKKGVRDSLGPMQLISSQSQSRRLRPLRLRQHLPCKREPLRLRL